MFKSGLVLEGGGSRAIYTSGVLDAFIENDITFPYVIGVSAGTCNGASFIGKNFRRQHDITINYVNDKRYMSVKSMIKNGEYLNSEWIFNDLTYDINPLDYDTFEKSKTKFCCVVVNAETGKAGYLYPTTLRPRGCPEIRASCALPLATKGYKINDKLYFDGGLVDSIPLKHAFEDGVEKCVVILTQHRKYQKLPVNQKMTKLIKKYPKIAETISNRHNLYNEQLKYVDSLRASDKVFVIQPLEPLNCKTLEKNTEKLEKIYQLGYQQGLNLIDDVKKFIND